MLSLSQLRDALDYRENQGKGTAMATETTTKVGHTPGPWHVGGTSDDVWVQTADPDANVICDIIRRSPEQLTEEDVANANVLAAAPDLLAALKAVQKWLMLSAPVENSQSWNESFVKANDLTCAAIAKAEGGAK